MIVVVVVVVVEEVRLVAAEGCREPRGRREEVIVVECSSKWYKSSRTRSKLIDILVDVMRRQRREERSIRRKRTRRERNEHINH